MKTKYILILSLVFFFSACQQDKIQQGDLLVNSPDSSIELAFLLDQGTPHYSVERGGAKILDNSRMGFRFEGIEDMISGFEIVDVQHSSLDETWEPVWGEERFVTNQYNEMIIHLKEIGDLGRKMIVMFRVFNDGVAFRYHIPEQEGLNELQILSEETAFNFVENPSVWYQACDTLTNTWENGYDTYERLYQNSDLAAIKTLMQTPATFVLQNGVHLAIHEANLTNYSSMTLALDSEKLELESHLVPWPDGIKVKTKAPMVTPWRTIQIAESPAKLAASRMILNLNEPSVLEDTKWIQPMKYVGIWWEMHMAKSTWEFGPKHGATTENAIRYIDFAADNGIGGVLVEGWNTGWEDWINNPDFNFTQPYPDYDLPYLVKYARDKGVNIIAHHETGGDVLNYENQMEDAFRYLNELGIHAVKTGYVGTIKHRQAGVHHHGQAMINHYRKVLETAAKYEVSVVAHEPIKPTGLRRTYPNMLSREAMRGMEFNAWSEGNPSSHTTILPFTMGLAGPLDYTPGIFKLQFDEYRKGNSTHTTLANQLALYVTLYSPVQMAADFPEHYKDQPAFKFIADIPTDWEQSIILDANIGQYVATARKCKKTDDWYLGVINNEESRQLELDIDFLDNNTLYEAEIYADGQDAAFDSNPQSLEISKQQIRRGQKLDIRLAAGGGQAIRFYPVEDKQAAAGVIN